MIIKPATDAERGVLETEAMRAQLLEEINVKSLELVESTDFLWRICLSFPR